jgi:hypothetical protein
LAADLNKESGLTLEELLQAADRNDVTRARRAAWELDNYLNMEIGRSVRFSFGFQGPYTLSEEDRKAADWLRIPTHV